MECGDVLYDEAACVVGEFRGIAGPFALLRPLGGGGPEWQADPADLRPASPEERLRAGVRAANGRTAREAAAGPQEPVPDLGRPPEPLRHCVPCALLAEQRRAARLRGDRSAETDANVLLRRHFAQEHS
ncbi:hypothetical protein ACGFMM_07000 [Streptomyces sp. NPDC048604]|uniref:hypothetical protein n=1 Tax=Streptomyces sp. NPDC048604 TaxID=3365578 RepID=UPI0037110EE8